MRNLFGWDELDQLTKNAGDVNKNHSNIILSISKVNSKGYLQT